MAVYDFAGKTVLISGAGAGLGLAAAKRFKNANANLVLTDFDSASVKAASDLAAEFPDHIAVLSGDIADQNIHQKLIDLAINKFGRIDIAINNAGIVHDQMRIEHISSDTAKKIFDVDVFAVLFAMQAQLPVMVKQFEETGMGGVILNTASVAGIVGAPLLSAYSAAKHAVVGLTKAAAIEYAKKGIRVNALCPAFTKTQMALSPINSSPHGVDKATARMVSNVPMARLGEIEEVVQAILWACDPENSFYTGQALALDGGLSA